MMRLHSLEIWNVRGVEHLRIEQLPETGVVVIHGENEAGKSTIVEAIDTVLTEKHTGAAKKIKALKPVDRDAGPEVELEVTVGPYHFRIHKRWLKKKMSELRVLAPRAAQFTGGEADDELDRILNEHLDRQLLDALFLRQDDLGSGVAAVGIPSVTNALEEASGMDTAAAEDSELVNRVQREYEKYFTARTGQPAKELKDAQERYNAAELAHNEATEALRQLDDVVVKHEAAQLAKRDAEEALPAAQAELAEREKDVVEARAALEKIEAQREVVDRAAADVEAKKEALERRRSAVEEVSRAAANLTALATKVEELSASVEDEKEIRSALEEKLERANQTYEKARANLQYARKAHKKKEREALGERLEHLGKLDKELADRRAEVAQAPEVANLKDIEQAANEVQVQERVFAAAAAKLVISGEGEFEVDGEVQQTDDNTQTIQLRDGMKFAFGKIQATYQAAAGDTSADTVAQARTRLAQLLEDAGCEDLAAAQKLREEFLEKQRAVVQAQREFKAALGTDDLGELEAKYAAQSADFEEPREHEGTDVSEEALDLSSAEAAEEAARSEVTMAEKELAPYRDSQAATQLAAATARHESAANQYAAAEEALHNARDAATDADVEEALHAAKVQLEQQRERLRELSAIDVDTVFALHKGAEEQVRSLNNAILSADGDMREYVGRIEMHSGVAERLAAASAELEISREVLAAVEKRANAARYLRELLLKHRDAARQRYAAPFVTKLNALARTVFGGDVDFELSEELVVTARSRNGQTIDMGSLSGGAKEQLAILTRFAIAGLVQESGVPVIVDDALGSTDSTRLNLMSTLFAQVGKHSQVLVLTCMPQRYARVPERTELAMDALKV